jgi:5-methylcytosine-specific restriction endonuclease McrA
VGHRRPLGPHPPLARTRRRHRRMSPSPWRRLRSTNAWRQLAKQTITEEPLCWLRLPGCTVRSTTADHIYPVTVRPELALVRANTRGACRSCNYRRGNTPANQLDHLRRQTPNQLDEDRGARRRKPAPALGFFGQPAPAATPVEPQHNSIPSEGMTHTPWGMRATRPTLRLLYSHRCR